MANQNIPIVNAGIKYVNGLRLVWLSGGLTINLSVGAARDNQDENDIIVGNLNQPVNQFIFLNSANIGVVNGLDAGALANNTNYYVYVIGDSTGNNAAGGIISASNLLPLLPNGYDIFRRVGALRTDGAAAFLKFYQYGVAQDRTYYYDIPLNVLAAGNATSYTAVNVAAVGANPAFDGGTEVYLKVNYTPAAATNIASFIPFGSIASGGIAVFGTGVAGLQQGMVTVPCITGQFLYKVTAAGDALTLLVSGFKDYLSAPQ